MTEPMISGQKQAWRIGEQIGSGGFGRVYGSEADDGTEVVIKLIPKQPGAARELLFENLSGTPNIIPILDSGEWQEYFFLVMPRAEMSLRHLLEETGSALSLATAIPILLDVAEALAHLAQGVVHRDLKPDNVLLYQGRWCLADFGLARYAEATTAPDTRKHAFTPLYAAPEQWRSEHATNATDVYAFGVMAFEMLEGRLPFTGLAIPDLREQHLKQVPPSLPSCPSALASLVTECMSKPAPARPTASTIMARLRTIQQPTSAATAKLQEANHAIITARAREAAAESAQQSVTEQRRELAAAARQSLAPIIDRFATQILEAAPTATLAPGVTRTIRLDKGSLTIDAVRDAPPNVLAGDYGTAPFDVVAYTAISVRQPRNFYQYEGRSHSLWFCDAHEKGVYRWFELAFMGHPLTRQSFAAVPFSLDPTDENAAGALGVVIAAYQVAWEPVPFDQGDDTPFIERWMMLFANAATGALQQPSLLPEQSGGRHRRS